MEIFTDIADYDVRPAAVSVGMFDGLHLGHRHLLSLLVEEARRRGLVSVVVTMTPHPRIVLSKGNDNVGILTTLAEQKTLLEDMGVDRFVVIPFTRQFSDLSAQQFIRQWLVERIGAKFLLMGHNHRFGSDDLEPEDYLTLAAAEGLEAERGTAFVLPGGEKVSSSEVRKALEAADVAKANRLLGRPYAIVGSVVHGDAIGRKIGYPTANIEADAPEKLIPADGVYAGRLIMADAEPAFCVVNIGSRPTVGGGSRRIEAHLIGVRRDLYGARVRLELTDYLRPEQQFADTGLLSAQIAIDEAEAVRRLSSH